MHVEHDPASAEESLVGAMALGKETTTRRALSLSNATPPNVPRYKRKGTRVSSLTDERKRCPGQLALWQVTRVRAHGEAQA